MSGIAVLIGTRPEAIKLMPVVRALQSAGTAPSVWVTGQHREMLEPILAELDLRADEHLQVMQPGQGLVCAAPGGSRWHAGDRDAVQAMAGEAAPLAGGQLRRVEAEQHQRGSI